MPAFADEGDVRETQRLIIILSRTLHKRSSLRLFAEAVPRYVKSDFTSLLLLKIRRDH